MGIQEPKTIAAAALVLLLQGCLLSSSTHTHQSGKYVSPQTLSRVEPGWPEADTIDLLGEPTSRTDLGEGAAIWRWEYREETNSRGKIFLVLSSRRRTENEGAVYVEFRDGRVVRTWRD